MHNTASLLPDIIDDGVRLLVYAGNAGEILLFHSLPNLTVVVDMMCNFIVRACMVAHY